MDKSSQNENPHRDETAGASGITFGPKEDNNTVPKSPKISKKNSTLKGDTDASINFLKQWHGNGPWQLHAMDANRKANPVTVFAADEEACRKFVDHWNGKRNLYFTVNRVKSGEGRKKTDITAMVGLHIDLDPPKTPGRDLEADRAEIFGLLTENLPEGVPAPSFIIDSGGGYWGLWPFKSPKETNADVEGLPPEEIEKTIIELERWNIGIEESFGKPYADNCFNIDRICRLPGTLNIPDKKKREAGRTEALAVLVHADDRRFGLNDLKFQKGEPRNFGKSSDDVSAAPAIAIGEANSIASLDDLPTGISEKCRETIAHGHTKHGYASRSEAYWATVGELHRKGVAPEMILGIHMDRRFKISDGPIEMGRKKFEDQIRKSVQANGKFSLNSEDKPYPTINNLRIALNKIGVRVFYDEMADRFRLTGLEGHGAFWTDKAERGLRIDIEERFSLKISKDKFADWILADAYKDKIHPVKEKLQSLTWDKVERLETWLIVCAGAPDTLYVRAVSRLFLLAAVTRVYYPGAKFDELLVLESDQGGDKSSMLQRLAMNEEWFSDSLPLKGDSKIAIEQTQGKWIVECAELDGISAKLLSTLKAFLSRQKDEARLAYGRWREDIPRQWVAIGTTNETKYLSDPTGNRRFWPISIDKFDPKKFTVEYVEQLWAEALIQVRKGASIRLDPKLYREAESEQKKRIKEDAWQPKIADLVGESEAPLKVTSESLWNYLGFENKDRKQSDNERLGNIMRLLGFEYKQFRHAGKKYSGYVRGKSGGEVQLMDWKKPEDRPDLF